MCIPFVIVVCVRLCIFRLVQEQEVKLDTVLDSMRQGATEETLRDRLSRALKMLNVICDSLVDDRHLCCHATFLSHQHIRQYQFRWRFCRRRFSFMLSTDTETASSYITIVTLSLSLLGRDGSRYGSQQGVVNSSLYHIK